MQGESEKHAITRRAAILGTIGALFFGRPAERRTGLHSMRYGIYEHPKKEIHIKSFQRFKAPKDFRRIWIDEELT